MVTTGARQRTTYKQSIREQTSRERNNKCVVDDRQKNNDVAVIVNVRLVKENQALKLYIYLNNEFNLVRYNYMRK